MAPCGGCNLSCGAVGFAAGLFPCGRRKPISQCGAIANPTLTVARTVVPVRPNAIFDALQLTRDAERFLKPVGVESTLRGLHFDRFHLPLEDFINSTQKRSGLGPR